MHLFIMSSLDHPVYRQIQQKRRPLLEKYGIPYTVILNDTESPVHDTTVPTFVPTTMEEILYPMGGSQPSMTMKFLSAVKQYFRVFPDFESVPNYIARINATVYIYFPQLLQLLDKSPHTRVLIGPAYGSEFVCGMMMIFSKDVLLHMLEDDRVVNKMFMNQPDDVVLSELSRPYCEWISVLPNFVYPDPETTTDDGLYRLDKIQPFLHKKWFFRIRNERDRRIDLDNWDRLVVYFDDITSEHFCLAPSNRRFIGMILMMILISIMIFCTMLFYWEKHRQRHHNQHGT